MPNIVIDRASVNLALLDHELRMVLGAAMTGISTRAGIVVVHLAERATGDHETQAKQIVLNHDASALTPEQQARQTRTDRLNTDRARFTTPLNPTDFSAMPLVQTLAARIAWLEQEIRDLRNL